MKRVKKNKRNIFYLVFLFRFVYNKFFKKKMVNTISNIGTEISLIISKTSSVSTISEQERINNFLDSINKLKVSLNNRVEKLKQIDSLFAQLTWVDIKSKEDEELIKKIIIDSKKFHSKLLRNYVNLKNSLWQSNICREEITCYKNILDDIEDSVFEIEQIFFSLRTDEEFNNLLKSI
ncbi:MAG: hypothetical protein WCY06_05035 [Flavobacteriaceae bacterium]